MYNRYIPQPDGSFHRRQFPDTSPSPAKRRPPLPDKTTEHPEPEPRRETTTPPQHTCRHCKSCPQKNKQQVEPHSSGIGTFLKQLLPKDFDTGDLMVILLLLLMASDSNEDQNTALLTLALYLFL